MSRHVPRLYCESPLTEGGCVRLDKLQSHHLLNVLRLKPGANLVLFDGLGGEYAGRVSTAGKNQAEVEIGVYRPVVRESPLRICLGQAMSRGERMDYTLQKAVELGVSEVQPLTSEHSHRIDHARQQKKLQHWRAVVVSAAEQCGRDRLPVIQPPRALTDWLPKLPDGLLKLVLDPDAAQGIRQLDKQAEVVLLAGPEGGFSRGEVEAACAAGFIGVGLGPRILRTETAAVAGIAALQTLWGDLGQ